MNYIYMQGKLLSGKEAALSIADRSFKYGDGVFETVRVENGKLFNIHFHEKRLKTGLDALKINFNAELLRTICHSVKPTNGMIRFHVSRGVGGRGYFPTESNPYAAIEVTDKLPEAFPVSLHISQIKAHAHSPAKTANALNYIMAAIEADEHNADNAILLDEKGFVCECTNANIFWVKDEKLFTPALDLPLIHGSVQDVIMRHYYVTQDRFTVKSLVNIDEIFITNTATIIQNVAEIKGHGSFAAGTFSAKVKEVVLNHVNFS